MGKLKLLLTRPFQVIRKGLMHFEEDMHRENCVSKYNIDRLPTIELTDLIKDFPEKISPYSFLDGTSLVTDILLLKGLAKQFEKCDYLEIGSWRGESVSNVAAVAGSCISLTLSDKEMRELNFGEDFIKAHGVFSKNISNLQKIECNSHTFDFNTLQIKPDLIFIDGDHTYAGVLNDTKKTFGLRKNERAVIVWHDYGYGVENTRHSVLEAILDGIPKDKHKNLYHVSNTMCAVYIENCKLPAKLIKPHAIPEKYFEVSVNFKKVN